MNLNTIGANNAYGFVQKALDSINNGVSTSSTSGASGSGFAGMVSDAFNSSMNVVKNSESVSAAAMTGKASVTDVVTAVNSADVALKSVVAIRDKVIAAYQDIIKMPI